MVARGVFERLPAGLEGVAMVIGCNTFDFALGAGVCTLGAGALGACALGVGALGVCALRACTLRFCAVGAGALRFCARPRLVLHVLGVSIGCKTFDFAIVDALGVCDLGVALCASTFFGIARGLGLNFGAGFALNGCGLVFFVNNWNNKVKIRNSVGDILV